MDKGKKIQELISFTFDNTENKNKVLDLFRINKQLAERIQTSTGIDTEGFYVSIDNYSILHTLNKHGEPTTEVLRGQLAVKNTDFFLVDAIIAECDDIELSSSKFQEKEVLIFKKEIENLYIARMSLLRKVLKPRMHEF